MDGVFSGWRLVAMVALALATCILAGPACAQDASSLAVRRALIDDARVAASTGDHARALVLADRALTIQSSPSLRLFAAEQQIALGRSIEALGSVELCLREIRDAPPVRDRETLEHNCTVLHQGLRARVSIVSITLTPVVAGVSVRINGRDRSATGAAAPFAVDPGAVEIEVAGPGYVTYRQRIEVAAGALVEVPIALQPEPAPVASVRDTSPIARSSDPPNTTVRAPAPTTALPTGSRARSGPHIAAVATTAAGGALLAIALPIFLVLRDANVRDCVFNTDNDLVCPEERFAGAETAVYVFHPLAIGSAVAGSAALAAGAVWWWLGARRPPPVTVGATLGPAGGAIILSGRF